MFARLEWIGLRATRALSAGGLAALLLLALLTLADGLLRWLANSPIEGVRDVGSLAIAVAVACCIPVGLMERSNISIRLLGAKLGPQAGRLADLLAAALGFVVVLGIAWEFTLYAAKLSRAGETTWVLKIPVAPFWYAVAGILWSAVLVQGIVVILEAGRVGGRFDYAAAADPEAG